MVGLFTDRLLVYVEEIDEQHEKIFEIVEEFCDICMDVDNKEKTIEVFNKLNKSLEQHFQLENSYMIRYGYPDVEVHIEKHNVFLGKLNMLDNAFKGDYITFTKLAEANQFFAEAFVTHLSDMDSKLGEFLRGKL